MEIHIKYTNIEANAELKEFLQKKLSFLVKLGLSATTHAWIEVAKVTRHHQQGKVWYAECDIKMPGKKSFRATSTNYDLGAALDEVKDELEMVFQKTKEKYRSLRRRGVK